MTFTLYYAPYSCAIAPLIALYQAGAVFDVKTINPMKQEQMSPDFLRLNPKHRVPVLMVDGEPLTENVAILTFLARQFPAAQLLPEGGMDEIRALSFMAWCASGVQPTLSPQARPERFCDLPDSAAGVRRACQALTREAYGVAEDMLGPRDWFFDRFTVADAHFHWCFRMGAVFGVDQSAFPHLRAHKERVEQQPAVKKALAFDAAQLDALKAKG